MQRQYLVLLLTIPILMMSLGFLGYSLHNEGPLEAAVIRLQPQIQAQEAIGRAQTAINNAYTNLVFADSVGSPINDLIGTLNDAIAELNQARNAYNQTDYSTTVVLAEGAENTANTVSSEAQLRGITTVAQTQALILPVVAVILLSIPTSYFVVTRWQKYRKEKRREFLRMEIRLPDDEKEDEKP